MSEPTLYVCLEVWELKCLRLLDLSCYVSDLSGAEIVSGFFSNAVPVFTKWLWSLKATTKTGIDLWKQLFLCFLFWVFDLVVCSLEINLKLWVSCDLFMQLLQAVR